MIRIPTSATNAKIVLQECYNDDWTSDSPEIFRDKVSRALGWMNIIRIMLAIFNMLPLFS